MKAEVVQTRELRMWRTFGGLTMGLVVAAIIIALARQGMDYQQSTWWFLGSLIGLWFIALPLVYLIDIRPRKKQVREEGNTKIEQI